MKIKETVKQVKKYNRYTCPKDDTWFADGGRCGWAWICAECEEFIGEPEPPKEDYLK